MNPYVMMLLQRLQNLEGARIPLTRGAGGRYLPATAAQKIPLAPVTSGAAGLGAAGIVASDPGAPVRSVNSLLSQSGERGAQAAPAQPAASPERPVAIPSGLINQLNMGAQSLNAPPAQNLRVPLPMRITEYDSTLEGRDMPPSNEDAPMPPRRPIGIGTPRMQDAPPPPRRPAELSPSESLLRRIFSGQDYQSNSRPVVEDRKVNWGDPDRAADFFRADRAARELGTLPPVERASGGQVGQGRPHKDAALVKALEIIERLMSNGR